MGLACAVLFSIILILVGMFIRLGVAESPIFEEVAKEDDQLRLPLIQMFKYNGSQLVKAALTFMGNGVAGYMITGGYILAYTSGSNGLGMDENHMLNIITLASASWIVTTLVAARLSDSIGRVRTYQIGFVLQLIWVFPLFMLIDTQTWAGVIVGILPLTAALANCSPVRNVCKMFPPRSYSVPFVYASARFWVARSLDDRDVPEQNFGTSSCFRIPVYLHDDRLDRGFHH